MIGHSVERATGEEAVGAVDGRAHNSHHIEEVVANTPYIYPYRITCIMPSNVNINPLPLVITRKTTISTTCAGTITSDMRMGGDNIPQYTPIYEERFQGCWRMLVGYWFTDGSEMKFGPNQHNNQLIYYIRDIKVLGVAQSYAVDDKISGVDICMLWRWF